MNTYYYILYDAVSVVFQKSLYFDGQDRIVNVSTPFDFLWLQSADCIIKPTKGVT